MSYYFIRTGHIFVIDFAVAKETSNSETLFNDAVHLNEHVSLPLSVSKLFYSWNDTVRCAGLECAHRFWTFDRMVVKWSFTVIIRIGLVPFFLLYSNF